MARELLRALDGRAPLALAKHTPRLDTPPAAPDSVENHGGSLGSCDTPGEEDDVADTTIEGGPAYVTGDPASGRAVVVLHELFGLTDDIRRIADRFAEAGYFAVAPNLFAPRGRAPLCIVRVMGDLSRGDGPALDQIEAARRWVVAQGIDEARIGVAGFCLGGGFTVLAAGRGKFAVAAPFYGDVPRSQRKVAGLCPTVASFGDRDAMFAAGADRLRQHLERLGQPHDVKLYEGVGHSFANPDHPKWSRPFAGLPPLRVGYDPEAAADAWKRVFAFFDETLTPVDA
ncbi:MAG: dienelactone hydrolase family protein [Deltaproteobacteria bacterium]|nr:MAG: dienelactone hydrolase family protein [Deltaproteobacteria bacterium]